MYIIGKQQSNACMSLRNNKVVYVCHWETTK